MTGSSSQAAPWRTPRKRPPPAAISASSTGATRSPSARSAWPTMPAHIRVGPYCPLSLMAATPAQNSTSPTGRISRPGGAVHRMAFVEDGRDHLVPRPEIGQQVGQEIAIARHVPQVMVGVDDGEVGLEDRLGCGLGEPRLVGPEDPAELAGSDGLRSRWNSPASGLAGAAPPCPWLLLCLEPSRSAPHAIAGFRSAIAMLGLVRKMEA